jgi:hypothetical protein
MDLEDRRVSEESDIEDESEEEEDVFAPVSKKRRGVDGASVMKRRRVARMSDVEVARGRFGSGRSKPQPKDKDKQREEARRASPNPFDDDNMLGFDMGDG